MMDSTSSFEEIINTDGQLIYTTRGNSMRPLLRQHKDMVVISKLTEPPKKYDVILFKRNNRYILHRILTVRENSYDTAGDHNWWKEYNITHSEIIGVLKAVIRDGKEIKPADPGYELYVHLWCDIYPVRFGVLRTASLIRKGLSKAYQVLWR